MPTKKAAADLKVITSPPEPVLAIPPGKLGMSRSPASTMRAMTNFLVLRFAARRCLPWGAR